YRKSCQQVSKKDSQPAERTSSFDTSRLPRSRRTARRASLRVKPPFIFSSAAISRKPFSSSSSSRLACFFRKIDWSPEAMLRRKDISLRGLQDSGDGRDLPPPFPRLAFKLLPALFGYRVIFRASAVLSGFPFALA